VRNSTRQLPLKAPKSPNGSIDDRPETWLLIGLLKLFQASSARPPDLSCGKGRPIVITAAPLQFSVK